MASGLLSWFISEDDLDGPSSFPARWTASSSRSTTLFERLILLGAIDPALYPPREYTDLRRLVNVIHDSQDTSTLQKTCVVYYLLRDYDDASQRWTAFAQKRRMPKTFVALIDAYWHLDNGNYSQGVKKLCSPGVVPDFIPEILEILSRATDTGIDNSRLIVSLATYVPTLSQSLEEKEHLQILVNAYLRVGRVEVAMDIARLHIASLEAGADDEEEDADRAVADARHDFLSGMLLACFASDPLLSSSLEKLLYYPFTKPEEEVVLDWITSTTSSGPSSSKKFAASKISDDMIPVINEWATSRLIAQGRYVEAITLLSNSLGSLRTSTAGHKRASDSLKELYSALPPIQRSMVDLTLSSASSSTSSTVKPSTSYAAAAANKPSAGAGEQEGDKASGSLTQIPWLAQPVLPNLPAPRSHAQAQRNASVAAEHKAGGKALDRATDLPLSAGGLLRQATLAHATTNTGANGSGNAQNGREGKGSAGPQASGIGRDGKRDDRMGLLSALGRAESPFRKSAVPAQRMGQSASLRQPKEGLFGSPVRQRQMQLFEGSARGASSRGSTPFDAQHLARKEGSPFVPGFGTGSARGSPAPSGANMGQATRREPTVQGFGSVRPPARSYRFDEEQEDREEEQSRHDGGRFRQGQGGDGQAVPGPETASASTGAQSKSAKPAQSGRGSDRQERSSVARPASATGQPSRASSTPASAGGAGDKRKRALPPGAFPSSGSGSGLNQGTDSDEEGSSHEQRKGGEDTQEAEEEEEPSSRRQGSRAAVGKSKGEQKGSAKEKDAGPAKKKGKKNPGPSAAPSLRGNGQPDDEGQTAGTATRRSKRLGSAQPTTRSQPAPVQLDISDNDEVEDSMMVNKKTPRRRRP